MAILEEASTFCEESLGILPYWKSKFYKVHPGQML